MLVPLPAMHKTVLKAVLLVPLPAVLKTMLKAMLSAMPLSSL